jgi:lysyl-tRNA synthetase class 1
MSSSKGNVLSIAGALAVVPPEALRYLVMREKPQSTISFDPGEPLLALVDEIEAAAAEGRPNRALELSRAAGFKPVGVSFKHLVVVAQSAAFDLDAVLATLARTGYPGLDRDAVRERLELARRWLDAFAPADLKFEVRAELPVEAATLAPLQRAFLAKVAERLDPALDAEAVHQLIYEIVGEVEGLLPADAFRAIYLSLLGKPKGPRAGWFVTILGPAFCARRFRQASA